MKKGKLEARETLRPLYVIPVWEMFEVSQF